LWIAAQNKGVLNVLGFGGALGSTYFQNKKFIQNLISVKWCIVEQPNFVKTGKQCFEDDNLKFYYSIDECLNDEKVDVILLSSVLQYIEKPYELLDKIKSTHMNYILFDRTPFVNIEDRITIQKVHPKIYKAKYPCWFFNKQKFLSYFEDDYELIHQFNALDHANIKSEFKGFLFKLKIYCLLD